ncbi:MAG: site-specific integrase [Clostridium sp.]|nr:site-specific integrase [Clostridium sp.]
MERRKDKKGRVLRKGENQRADGTYMYRYSDLNGKRKCIYGKTLDILRKKEEEINQDISDGIYTTDITLNELFIRYIEQNINIKPRVKHKYEDEYSRWIKNTWLGKKRIKDIVKSDITKFYKELKEKGYANGTIKCIHKYINGSLNMAYEDDMIRRNFAYSCIEPYKETGKRIALSKEETAKFLETAEAWECGKNYLLGFKLMLLTGMRIGEVEGLTWSDIDFKERIINVNHQFVQGDENSRTTYHIDTPKTFNAIRKVPMSDDVYDLLKLLRETTYFDSLKFNAEVDGYKGFVLHTRTGLPILTARFNDYAKKVVKRYNDSHDDQLPNISCHICRHTFCTRMAELNMNPTALQKIVGHGSYNTTANVYISVDDDFVNEEFYKVMRGCI